MIEFDHRFLHIIAFLTFYDAAINKRDSAAASKLIGGRYVQHNPLIGDELDGLRTFLTFLQKQSPNLRAEIKRMFADDDYVIVHTHGTREPGQRGSAIVDIFKIEGGKIIEHWDVIQPIPESAANQNGLF